MKNKKQKMSFGLGIVLVVEILSLFFTLFSLLFFYILKEHLIYTTLFGLSLSLGWSYFYLILLIFISILIILGIIKKYKWAWYLLLFDAGFIILESIITLLIGKEIFLSIFAIVLNLIIGIYVYKRKNWFSN